MQTFREGVNPMSNEKKILEGKGFYASLPYCPWGPNGEPNRFEGEITILPFLRELRKKTMNEPSKEKETPSPTKPMPPKTI